MRVISKKTALNIAFSAFFVASLAIPFLGLWTEGSGTVEKRTLAPFPKLTFTKSAIEEFPTAFDAYVNDNFGLRDELLTLQSRVGKALFNQSGSPKVIAGRADWLIYAGDNTLPDMQRVSHFSSDDLEQWKASIDARGAWLQKQGIAYRIVVAPDKQSVYGEQLPSRYSWRGPSRLDALRDYLRPSPYFVDILPAMQRQKQVAGGRLYFHTDTHWNTYGGYVGYRAIVASLQSMGLPSPVSISDAEFVRSDVFVQRDLSQMARLSRTEADVVPDKPIGYCGQPVQVMPPVGLDVSSVAKFGGYMCPTKTKTALIFHDSFMTALGAYLTSEFGRVVYVWAAPNDEMFIRMVQQEHPDVVIEERVERSMQWVPKDQLAVTLAKLSDPGTRTFTTAESVAQKDAYEMIQEGAELTSDAKGRYVKINGGVWARIQEESQTAGYFDKLERTSDGLAASGWAGFPADKEPADYIVLAVGSRIIYVAPTKSTREDVADYYDVPALGRSGFNLVVPNEILSGLSGPIQAFAVRGRKVAPIKIQNTEMSSL